MKKLAILMTLALAMSTAVLANPVFEARGNEASNALYQKTGGRDCDDTDRCIRPGKIALYSLEFVDEDSDGDGISDGLIEGDVEIMSTNKGQIISAATSEKPRFKPGAELSKFSSAYVGDLDGDGYGDVALDIRQEQVNNKKSYTFIGAFPKDWTLPTRTETLNKAELIDAIASDSGLSKADSKKALETFVDVTGEIIL